VNGTLLIYAPQLEQGELLWHHLGEGVTAQQGQVLLHDSDAMAELAKRAQDTFTAVILPGELVRWFSVAMPSKQRALISSLPFQIEDQISTPIEQMHVVPGHFKNGTHTAIAIEHTQLATLLDAFNQHSIDINLVSADYLLLNESEAGTAIKHRDHIIVRTPLWSGRVHQSLYPLIKTRLTAPSDPEQDASLLDTLTVEALDDMALLNRLAKSLSPKRPPLNLLTGPYEHQTLWQQWLQPYKKPLWAAAALMVLNFGLLITSNLALQKQVDQLDDAMINLYKTTFPEARRITNPVAQLRGALRQSGQVDTDGAVLVWLSQAAPLLTKEKVTLLNVRFTQAPDTLRLQLQATDYAAIERISTALTQSGVQADLGTLVRNDDQVSGLLTIRGS
jgi:general secretion pathway protein L